MSQNAPAIFIKGEYKEIELIFATFVSNTFHLSLKVSLLLPLSVIFLSTGTAHCANMYPATDDDLPALKQARLLVQDYIQTWLDI